jgi:acyl-ACP thioesterase
VPENDFVPRPSGGRIVKITRHVGLGDVRRDATLRLDALARALQDAADEDAASSGIDDMGYWLLRRLAIDLPHTPRLRAPLTLSTWCSGVGARWAERRTDVHVGDVLAARAVGIWVHVDRETGAPTPLPDAFERVWSESAHGRRVSARLRHPGPPHDAARDRWLLRATDIDMIDHVNNAAYWAPVEEELSRRDSPRVRSAEIEFRSGLALEDAVELRIADHEAGFGAWLCVAGDVRASALIGCAS